jgi:hypothetical protein
MRVLTLLLALVVVVLIPLGFADAPDPTWVGGLWNDDDFDVLVLGIVRTLATVAIVSVPRVQPQPLVRALAPPAPPARRGVAFHPTCQLRAPPAA